MIIGIYFKEKMYKNNFIFAVILLGSTTYVKIVTKRLNFFSQINSKNHYTAPVGSFYTLQKTFRIITHNNTMRYKNILKSFKIKLPTDKQTLQLFIKEKIDKAQIVSKFIHVTS